SGQLGLLVPQPARRLGRPALAGESLFAEVAVRAGGVHAVRSAAGDDRMRRQPAGDSAAAGASAMSLPVAIVGAGLAGLTAATDVKRHGVPVGVFEAGKHVAGHARSERDAEGFTYDIGAHFITNRLAAAVGCSASCRDMPRYGETVWLRKRRYS